MTDYLKDSDGVSQSSVIKSVSPWSVLDPWLIHSNDVDMYLRTLISKFADSTNIGKDDTYEGQSDSDQLVQCKGLCNLTLMNVR